ncbi:MAG: LacI family DNA-binding transcriptional regulator [Arachnia sp.]
MQVDSTGAGAALPGAAARPGRSATIYDVASLAGVSHQTVSRYLRNPAGIKPANRERVRAAIAALDYRPNLAARSLPSGRSHRIGALTQEMDQIGPSQIVLGAAAAARESGYLLDILSLDMTSPQAIQEALEVMAVQDLAGILALGSTDQMQMAVTDAAYRVPFLSTGEIDETPKAPDSHISAVGFPALIDHLAELGHRDFLHIAGPQSWPAARNRRRAFERAVRSRGLRCAGVLPGDWSARSGHEAIAAMPPGLRPTAIIAANDQMALGAILALSQRGLRIPEDVSVTGVDDTPESGFFRPPLTTLRLNFTAQGRSAALRLIQRIEGLSLDPPADIEADLVIRHSTGPAAPHG